MDGQPNFEDVLKEMCPADLWVTMRHSSPGQGYKGEPTDNESYAGWLNEGRSKDI